MTDKHRVLRAELKKQDIDPAYLADYLHIDRSTLYRRLGAQSPWTIREVYSIMDMLHLPYDQIHIVFPPGGMYAGELTNQPTKTPEELLAEAVRLVARRPA